MSWPPEQRGTNAMVGIATALAPLESHGAGTLGRGSCTIRAKGPMPANIQPNLRVRLLVVLDMEEVTLGYATGGTYLGPAFCGLKDRTLYPAVNAVCGQCQVHISYLGESREEPHTLLHLSCLCVCQAMGAARLGQVSALPLPPAMKCHLLYQ
ncbi:SPRY domain-containing SOCS box protein 2 [Pteropus alecto]|uniref:SPRY domain-containing SOCS box protein 2 n=1 Tax=Pteropus alecto TaxID=9402 RepID=L5KF08_PTEAL|nr:SPRY domain-containing SOCS box protein 2 [Pteropus alecto]